jgi:hypothetical protein
MWHVNPLLGNAHNTYVANNTGAMFSLFARWCHTTEGSLSLSLMLRPTASRPVSLGIKHPSGAYDQIFSVRNTEYVWREDGSVFCMCRWPLPAQSFSVVVPWDLRPYFTVSDLRIPFSSPPTTRRVTVEVFDPASTRAVTWCVFCRSSQHANRLAVQRARNIYFL